jgi:hypothetical protein
LWYITHSRTSSGCSLRIIVHSATVFGHAGLSGSVVYGPRASVHFFSCCCCCFCCCWALGFAGTVGAACAALSGLRGVPGCTLGFTLCVWVPAGGVEAAARGAGWARGGAGALSGAGWVARDVTCGENVVLSLAATPALAAAKLADFQGSGTSEERSCRGMVIVTKTPMASSASHGHLDVAMGVLVAMVTGCASFGGGDQREPGLRGAPECVREGESKALVHSRPLAARLLSQWLDAARCMGMGRTGWCGLQARSWNELVVKLVAEHLHQSKGSSLLERVLDVLAC